MSEIYTSGQIQVWTGCSRINLVHWVDQGVIEPMKKPKGRGNPRLFSFQNVVEIAVCAELHKYKISTTTMKQAVESLQERWDDVERVNLMAIANGEEILFDQAGLLNAYNSVLIINLKAVITNVKAMVTASE